MNKRKLSTFSTPILALAIALLAAACGSDGSTTDAQRDAANSTGSGTANSTDANTPNGADVNTTTTDRDHTDVATMVSTEIHINTEKPGTPAYDERFTASKDIRGYRALLMAELEAIRTRLNDGTRPADAAKKDQERAADLAQGLERMDRLIKAVEESDDLTWTSIRGSQLKEAGEVRVWATEHGYKVG
jgi:hypothetical protein